ncbi:M23 family metallopeptidase [Actinoplanes sp. NPDC049118]|uniref:M23 family metallopeptidase n=1 Tax=Actinoplanes sp. NPDC049118 TaxID=3155769 RepID=UPI00340D851D
MNRWPWIAVAIIGVLFACSLPLAAILDDNLASAACTADPAGGGQARISEHAGAVGQWKSTQVDNAAVIVAVGQRTHVPARGWVIAVATAMTESRLINTSKVTDHDSVGLFQQRPSQGWGTPAQLIDPFYTSRKFYAALMRVRGWETLPLTVAAQRVQRSAYPDRYAEFENDAEKVVAAVTGKASISDLPGASLADCGTDTPTVISSGGWTQPVRAGIVSGFRRPSRPKHQGVDLGAKRYTVIRAASAGKVVWADCDDDTGNCDIDGSPSTGGCGYFVEILHAGGVATRYCHMVRKPDVAYGQHVNAGQPIGLVGTSGHSSGPHLHFEVHVRREALHNREEVYEPVDPVAFLAQRGVKLGAA